MEFENRVEYKNESTRELIDCNNFFSHTFGKIYVTEYLKHLKSFIFSEPIIEKEEAYFKNI